MNDMINTKTRYATPYNLEFGIFKDCNHNIVLFHHIDMDGYFAAYIVKTAIEKLIKEKGTDVVIKCVPYNYEKEIDLTSYLTPYRDDVIVVDLSLKGSQIKNIMELSNRFFIMDHHVSTLRIVNELMETGYNRSLLNKGKIDIDMNNCGTAIAYYNLIPLLKGYKKPINEKIIKLVDLYDRWVYTDLFPMYLNSYVNKSHQLTLYSNFIESVITSSEKEMEEILSIGKEFYELELKESELRVKAFGKEYTDDEGHIVLELCGPGNSTIFGKRGTEVDIMKRKYFKDNSCTVSMYTCKENIDVSKIAESHGGGGHKKAAGYVLNF